MTADAQFDIARLAELGSVSRRTVRYYVQRGLLPPPTGTGRGPHYTRAHVDQLIRIRELQERGVSLDEVADGMERSRQKPQQHPATEVPLQEVWMRASLGPGVELHVERARAFDTATLLRVAQAVTAILSGCKSVTSKKGNQG